MAVKVVLFAAFAEFVGSREIVVNHRDGMTVSDIWNEIRQKYPSVNSIPTLFAITDEYVPSETQVQDGDTIMVFPPLSGGAPEYIPDKPLSVQRALELIQDSNAGGEAIFVGRVRGRSEGKSVQYLFYECQISMAEKQIDRIVQEMFSKWPLKKVHIEHRIGKLDVGEIAVIVAVSSEHRREALDACRYGIDEVKKRVPIWKKEVSTSGEEWVGVCGNEDYTTEARRHREDKK